MKKVILPKEQSNCISCGKKGTLNYYKESSDYHDAYWCSNCFRITLWDGKVVHPTQDEAYPNRDK